MPTRLTNKTFIQKSKLIHGDKYDYSNVNYLRNKIRINIICPKHGEFEQVPNNHLKGYGCLECGKKIKKRLTPNEFITRSNKIHNNKFDYSLVSFGGVMEKVEIICPKHGVFKQAVNGHLSGRGCRECNQSKGEKEIYRLLKERGVQFIAEHKFDDCRNINPLPFDFYLPDHNTCIEFDGEQHFISNSYFKHEKFEDRQLRDKIKNEYCHNNNIRLIRIGYKEASKIEDIILNI